MRKMRIISIIFLIITIIGYILWRFVGLLPDWTVRVFGVLMLISIFTSVFSSVKISMSKK